MSKNSNPQNQDNEFQDERQAEDARMAKHESECQAYDGAGFPGCGDGSDDLADFNQNEMMDYLDE